MNHTTKRFSHSLAEAFPAERSGCIETPRGHVLTYAPRAKHHAADRLVMRVCVYCALAVAAMGLWGWL